MHLHSCTNLTQPAKFGGDVTIFLPQELAGKSLCSAKLSPHAAVLLDSCCPTFCNRVDVCSRKSIVAFNDFDAGTRSRKDLQQFSIDERANIVLAVSLDGAS